MDERRDDWRSSVDENLSSLNAGQRLWERELDLIRRLLAEIDNLLRGDPERDTDGIVARLHSIENKINLLEGVVLRDKAGGHGLVDRVEALEAEDRRSERRIKVWVALVGLASAIAVAALTNLDRIEAFFNKRTTDPVDRAIEHAKHPRRRHVVVREIRSEPEAEDQGGDSVP